MVIAGNCLLTSTDKDEVGNVYETAMELGEFVNYYRCKIWGGGTSPDKYMYGIGDKGIKILETISKEIMPCGTEVHTPEHIRLCKNLDYIWIGARNSQNYTLLNELRKWDSSKPVFIKRGPAMTIDEVIGLHDILIAKVGIDNFGIIERGINTFDRLPDSRWSPDIKGLIRLKTERPDVFMKTILDCSHSVGRSEYVYPLYKVGRSIGVGGYMFECTSRMAQSYTDKRQMLTVDQLRIVLGDH